MDRLTKEQRHRCMSAIRGKNTKPEIVVRKFLFGRGFRYRLNHPRLPGHPDIVLRKYRTVIFVNGCFWHGHDNCKYYRLPKTNVDFWRKKVERNKKRDVEEQRQLVTMGGIALQSGSASWNLKSVRRLSNHWLLHWTISFWKTVKSRFIWYRKMRIHRWPLSLRWNIRMIELYKATYRLINL